MVPKQKTKICTYRICHFERQCITKKVPYRVICDYVTEKRIKKVPYTVCKTVHYKKVIKIPHCVCKKVPYTVTRCVPRTVCFKVPVTVCCPTPCGRRRCDCISSSKSA